MEYHYEQLKLLPHLGCVLDNFDNISICRPPLPSFQYNLLHQKLTVLNCCIEERTNNSRYVNGDMTPGFEECSSDSEISYFSDSEEVSDHGIMESLELPDQTERVDESNSMENERDEQSEKKEKGLVKPEGKGILNWSGWFLAGTDIPCFIPITKDKNILTVSCIDRLFIDRRINLGNSKNSSPRLDLQ